ncbi:hypothetical protein SAMN05446037_100532 [Anaerovirgula multivorans]|uniref:Uroporphyrinogen decarboxylase (URO-D) n=1 Tax=Anaerovirgula multivorans TaxID=312168 RepID=A0A239C720_9FIRM|nr:uroporphyrinogen decarboxylase [Anaerovirgula multivorans]SNS15729.1 hypothetical protein SAMN05446037_100532 [Anaerovirgula multivorans]
MQDIKKLQKEREQLFKDLFDGKIPKRVPIHTSLPLEFCIQYAGLPLAETQWTLEGVEEALDKACQITSSDYYPIGFSRYPAHLQILGSRAFVMGSSGFIQHPGVAGMEAIEYDELIKNPYDCIMEKVLPRLYPELDTDPITRSLVMAKAFKAFFDYVETYEKIDAKLIEKYGFHIVPKESIGSVTTPFDFLTDFLRGFKGIAMDVKRNPEKVIEACEAVLPTQIKRGIPPVPSRYGYTFLPLHMGTYLRDSDFEKLYWPTFSKMVNTLAQAGQPCLIFCEHNWMRYLDYLYELPENTRFYFEFGDPKLAKEKLGKKHIISGFYPLTYLRTATKQQCIDKAKELLDILAPGGKYYFTFDKSPVTLDSVNVENYTAVLQYVAKNGKYDYPGGTTTLESKQKDKLLQAKANGLKSKYYKTWDEYKEIHPRISPKLESAIATKLQSYEEMVFKMIFMLT